ncbi:MAG: glycosyltransferase family 39 protein, partial [Nanoarchaeota archaeon]|nr:glycosyltransferase family 39 protein [Nanoarchaeota archaeon]
EEKTSEENAGGESADEFNFIFKRLAWFNFNVGIGDAWGNEKYVLWFLRILISPFVWVARLQYVLTKWAYKEGWWYSGTLIAIIIINFIFVFPLLGDFIGGDEFHTYSVAKTLSKTGKFNLAWNFLYNTPGYNYKMSLIPQVNLAIFFKLFGENIVIAHMSSFLFSIVFIFLSYYLIKKFLNKPIAIFFIIYFTTTPFFIFQSIYIREYIYLLVISLTIPFLLIKISMIQKNKNLFFYIAFTLILIYIAYGLRIFSLLFLIPLIFSSLINIYTRSIKKLKKPILILINCFIFLILILTYIFRNTLYELAKKELTGGGFLKDNLIFDWKSFDLSFFVINPLFLKTIFTILIFISLFYIINSQKQNIIKNVIILTLIFILLHLTYGYTAKVDLIAPRYLSILLPLNFILLFFSLYFILKIIIQKRNIIFIILLFFIILSNFTYWTSVIINSDYNSGDNFIDFYDQENSTSIGRIKEQTDVAYPIILNDILKKNDSGVSFMVGEYIVDPRLSYFNKVSNKINLYCARWLPYNFKEPIKCSGKNYLLNYPYDMNYSYFKLILNNSDSTYLIFPSRKAYKYPALINFGKLDNFSKISGTSVDDSGVEVYVFTKIKSDLSE